MKQFSPKHESVRFILMPGTKWYKKEFPELVERLPLELKIENRMCAKINSEMIITSRTVNKQKSYFSGLQRLCKGCYNGDYKNANGKKSLVIYVLDDDWQTFTAYFFTDWYIHNPKSRFDFGLSFVQKLN